MSVFVYIVFRGFMRVTPRVTPRPGSHARLACVATCLKDRRSFLYIALQCNKRLSLMSLSTPAAPAQAYNHASSLSTSVSPKRHTSSPSFSAEKVPASASLSTLKGKRLPETRRLLLKVGARCHLHVGQVVGEGPVQMPLKSLMCEI